MNRTSFAAVAVAALAACAGGQTAEAPIYELRATAAPLRYQFDGSQSTVIEIPSGGEQKVETQTAATIAVSYGTRTEAGLPFDLTFEALDVTGAGAAPDLSALVGAPIRGVIDDDGEVTIEEAPEVDIPGADPASLAGQTLALLMVPLPPDGDPSAASWPLERTRSPGGGMTGTTTFSGSASFAADSAAQGGEVRTIVSRGDLRQRATGTPAGAPSEVDVDFEGESTTRYVWDPRRGVVLHVEQELKTEGTITMQTMSFPTTATGTQTVDLLP